MARVKVVAVTATKRALAILAWGGLLFWLALFGSLFLP